MKLIYVSNFMNHHQLPFSLGLLSQPGVEYTFVALKAISQERLDMGYEDMNHKYPFILCAYDSEEKMHQAVKLIDDADAAIYGSCPDSMIMRRTSKGKLCFKFSERYFKKGTGLFRIPHNFASAWKHLKPFEKRSLYFCCSSAYTAADLNHYTNFRGKAFKWGYFPETRRYDVAELMKRKLSAASAGGKHPQTSILWVGRLIELKHPDASIRLAEKLKHKGYEFELNIIGNGMMERQLREQICRKHLDDCVHMLGAMSPEEVREHMEAADIFLFTSDFNEGWGAVLNEAMNSACAVVASHAIGSVPFLLHEGENGLIYKNGDENGLLDRVVQLIEQPEMRKRLGRKAYQTLTEQWNAETAAERFLQLSEALLQGRSPELFEDGPCSKAEILKNGWYNK